MDDKNYRLATKADGDFMSRANLAWLQDQYAAGGPLLVTTKNHRIHMDLFWSYMNGERTGLAIVYQPPGGPALGISLAGEDLYPPRWDTNIGRVAYVWLSWVDPTERLKGIAFGSLEWGRSHLLGLGFKVAGCATLQTNPGGANLARAFGILPIETLYRIPL